MLPMLLLWLLFKIGKAASACRVWGNEEETGPYCVEVEHPTVSTRRGKEPDMDFLGRPRGWKFGRLRVKSRVLERWVGGGLVFMLLSNLELALLFSYFSLVTITLLGYVCR